MFYKPEIRKAIRAKRMELTSEAVERAAKAVATELVMHPSMINSQHIGFYMTDENELDPAPLVHALQKQGKSFYLPAIPPNQESISYYLYNTGDALLEDDNGILEPDITLAQPFATEDLDVILVPVVAFDPECNRIGRGAGHFDRTLEFCSKNSGSKRPQLIGLAYEFQKIPKVVVNDWDIPLDFIFTEEAVYQR